MNYKYVLCVFAICSLQGAIQKSLFELQRGLSLFSRAVAGYPGHSFPEPAVKGPNLDEKYRTFIPVFVKKLETINLDQLNNAVMDSIDLKDSLDNNMSGLRDTALNRLIEITNSQIGLTNFKALERAVTSAYPVQTDKNLLDLFRPAVSKLYDSIRGLLINELKLLYYITELSRKLSGISDLDEFLDFSSKNELGAYVTSGKFLVSKKLEYFDQLVKNHHTRRVASALQDFYKTIDDTWKKITKEKDAQTDAGLTDVGRQYIDDLQQNEKTLKKLAWQASSLDQFLGDVVNELPYITTRMPAIIAAFTVSQNPDFIPLNLSSRDVTKIKKLHDTATNIWNTLQERRSKIKSYDEFANRRLEEEYMGSTSYF